MQVVFIDTRVFYDKHYYEIEELRMNAEKQDDEPITIKGDYKHYVTEYSIQESAFSLCNVLGL